MTKMLITAVAKRGIFILIITALLSALIDWQRFPFSIVIGGALSVANLKSLSLSVERFMNGFKPNIVVVVFSALRLLFMGILLFLLVKLELIHIPAFLFGFTIILMFILYEGYWIVKPSDEYE